jgi:hypothetical protein
MRGARTVFAGKCPIMPKASEDTVFVLVISDRTAEMAANVAQRFDLTLILVKEDVVIVDPPGKLAGFL